MKSIFLFDIDGTLVSTGGAGRRAIDRAFGSLHGRPDACAHFSFDGMTDRAIARAGLRFIDVEATDARIDALLARYVELLHDEVRATPDAHYVVHPGARELVEATRAAGHAVGLGTGNVRDGARAKLERVGLFAHFSFGGYGDDHELRPELIRAGAQRGAQQLGVALSAARVVIIGDTPRDVHAALAIGARCLGVATGRHSVRELLDAGAAWAVETLAAPMARDALLGDA